MRVIKLIIISLVLSMVVIFCPIFFMCDTKEAISLGATILGGLAGVGAILFGFIIYEDLGIGKRIIDKKVDTVIEVLEELKTIQIRAAYYSGEHISGIMFMVLDKRTKFAEMYGTSEFDGKKVKDRLVQFLPENYFEGFGKLSKLKTSIWMPTELLSELDIISPSSMTSDLSDEKHKNSIRVTIGEKIELDEKGEKTWMRISDKDLTLEEFYNQLQGTILATETWLQKNSRIKIDLNL